MVTIAIVGAGFAGLRAYSTLKKKLPRAKLLLFDKENQFTYIPSLHIALAKPEYLKKIQFDLAKYYPEFIHDEVVDITKNTVVTRNNTYDFDYMILATGSGTNYFGNTSIKQHSYPVKTAHHVLRLQPILEKAEQIIIIGGGLTGVEYGCMLAHKYRHVEHKQVTIISATNRLLPALPEKNGQKALAYLKKCGAQVLLGQKVTHAGPRSVELNSGMKLHSDCTLMCAGVDQSSKFCDTRAVDEHFRLREAPNIYLAGDLCKNHHTPTAHNAMIEGELAAKRIIGEIKHKNPHIRDRKDWQLLAVAMGPSKGTFSTQSWTLPLFFTGLAKKIVEISVMNEFRRRVRLFV